MSRSSWASMTYVDAFVKTFCNVNDYCLYTINPQNKLMHNNNNIND